MNLFCPEKAENRGFRIFVTYVKSGTCVENKFTLTEKPIGIDFLILSLAETPDTQVQVLALTNRAAQDRYLLKSLTSCQTAEEVLAATRNWETA